MVRVRTGTKLSSKVHYFCHTSTVTCEFTVVVKILLENEKLYQDKKTLTSAIAKFLTTSTKISFFEGKRDISVNRDLILRFLSHFSPFYFW